MLRHLDTGAPIVHPDVEAARTDLDTFKRALRDGCAASAVERQGGPAAETAPSFRQKIERLAGVQHPMRGPALAGKDNGLQIGTGRKRRTPIDQR
jgi:hypothetical protein